MSNIPSNADFARADELDRERSRNLDAASRNVAEHFQEVCRLFKVHILPQRDVSFRAYIFFYTDENIRDSERNGMLYAIQDYVYEELERQGRGKRGEISVAFEFDSDENVAANYDGDYFLRLRN
ncbi:MAG: hypothetical protein WC073_16385 [Sterolibacterium sp.]